MQAGCVTTSGPLIISAEEVSSFDTAGALLLHQYLDFLAAQGASYQFQHFKPEWQNLLQLILSHPPESLPPQPRKMNALALIGKEFSDKFLYFLHFFDFIGRMMMVLLRAFYQPWRFHGASILKTMDEYGCRALPIVGLLCFLIGIVLAYQLGGQLQTYGADIFIVYLTGVAILREFGPLIAAIILAGRSSSAMTAQIGSMKVNQEIDALLAMGLYPVEFLVLPKLIGMLLIVPFIIFWADLLGVMGSMFMAKVSLNINYFTFIHQFGDTMQVKQLFVGLSKAPVFALIIALVGCYQGFQVEYSAGSVGSRTTKSVVQAIFLIIIADAGFSILYSLLGI